MDAVNATSYDALGLSRKPNESNSKELGQEDFLTMLVAQMNHQNPLEPQDNAEFITQMAQFGTVDGISKLNTSFDGLAQMLQSNQVLQGATLVGKTVTVPSNQVQYNGSPIEGVVNFPNSVTDVRVSYYDTQGQLLHQDSLGNQMSGPMQFQWDGIKDGQVVAAGNVRVEVTATVGQEAKSFNTHMHAKVSSVNLEGDNGLTLKVAGMGDFDMNQIIGIK